jgi:hypothetical protein
MQTERLVIRAFTDADTPAIHHVLDLSFGDGSLVDNDAAIEDRRSWVAWQSRPPQPRHAPSRRAGQLAITTNTAMANPTIRFCHIATVAAGPAPPLRARAASQVPSQLGNATTIA